MGVAITAAIATIIVMALGGGLGYLIWLKTRPKKQIWKAKVYQLGEGVRQPRIGKDGSVKSINLQDMRPYAKDILEKVEKEHGQTIYRLQKLNKTTPAVEGDVVEYWGEGEKEVSVLLLRDGCTLLRKGYDKETGEEIFDPLPHDRINLIKSEIAIRKDRLGKEKDILQAISPWIVGAIVMLGLVAIAYIQIQGFIKIADKQEKIADKLLEVESIQQERHIPEKEQIKPKENNLGKKDKIPSIE